jgi:hypothetical protein
MILMVPRDAELWPSLGGQVCDFIEQNMVFGPGDLRGQPVILDDEWRALIYRMYEVYPQGHDLAGRRRFKRCGLMLPKGLAKTEKAAMLAICELHPEAPVRCTGFTRQGEPIGGPVTDPYIPLVATSQEQSDELAFTAMRVIVENSPLRDDFDIGLERILRKRGDGKAEALSTNPNSRDGARTTFSVVDESHRLTLPKQKQAYQVMLTNIPKRYGADGWMLETTTAPEPGAGSVAEGTLDYARSVDEGRAIDTTSLFFFYRYAAEQHNFSTADGRMDGLKDASGEAWRWRDLVSIAALWDDPGQDHAYLERVYGNRLVRGTTQAFSVMRWRELAAPRPVEPGTLITVGFDGSQFHDSTAIVCTEVATGYQWLAQAWEKPATWPDGKQWQVPAEEVDACVHRLFETFNVWRMYCDPPYWQSWVSKWIGIWGKERVLEWWTNRRGPMCAALEAFNTSIRDGSISHDGSKVYERHIGNARRKNLPMLDDQGKPIWLIEKERHDSPNKIDVAMAGVLSWEARNDAIAAGVLVPVPEPQYQALIFSGR